MSQPVKVGFVGTGGIANSHLRNLAEMENVRIAALCDLDESRVNAAVETYGGQAYIDYRKMFDNGGGGSRTDFIVEGHYTVQLGWGDVRIIPEDAATIAVPDEQPLSIDEAFIGAIQTEDRLLIRSSYSDGLKSAAVSIAANQSSREHRPVCVPAIS